MKRLSIILISTLMLVLFLSSCGTSSEEQGTEEQTTETHYTEQQTEMGNYMNGRYAYIYNGWVYTIGWGASTNKPLFLKMRTDGTDDSVIRYYEEADYITVNGEYIYAVMVGESSSNIYRYRLGGEEETLLIENAYYMQIVGDSIYYCKCDPNDVEKTINYCKSDLEGKNEEIVLEKEIYTPYLVGELLFYQDDNDNETIHKYNLSTKEDVQITTEKTYGYVLNDDYLYCVENDRSTTEEDYNGFLVKVDLKTNKAETLYDGASTFGFNIKDDTIFFINTNDENRLYSIDKNGENISLVTQDNHCWPPCIYDDKMIYIDAENYEYCDNIYICNLDGSDKVSIRKDY